MNEFFFGAFNVFFFLASIMVLIHYYKKRRHILVKASFWFSFFFCIRIQLYCCLFFDDNFQMLTDNVYFLILTQIVPFTSIACTGLFLDKQAKKIWNDVLIQNNDLETTLLARLINVFFVISIIILSVYLSFVPFTETGFYTIFFSKNVLMATLAREHSLKLLPYTWLKYLYQFYAQFLSLFIASCITIFLFKKC